MTVVTAVFTANGQFVAPAGVTHVDYIIVGAGGPGGNPVSNASGLGGKHGEIKTGSLTPVSSGSTYNIVVGQTYGQSSTAFGVTAEAGAMGGHQVFDSPTAGENGYGSGGNAQPGGSTEYGAGGAAGVGYGAGGGGGRYYDGDGGAGSYGCVIITYNLPVLSATGDPLTGNKPLEVDFSASATESPLSWLWSFGTGEGTSTSQNPTHTYTLTGTYSVTCTVTNAYAVVSSTFSVRVKYPAKRWAGLFMTDVNRSV